MKINLEAKQDQNKIEDKLKPKTYFKPVWGEKKN